MTSSEWHEGTVVRLQVRQHQESQEIHLERQLRMAKGQCPVCLLKSLKLILKEWSLLDRF